MYFQRYHLIFTLTKAEKMQQQMKGKMAIRKAGKAEKSMEAKQKKAAIKTT